MAAATLAPPTVLFIRNMFLDLKQRTFEFGVWTTSFFVGAALGPSIGGVLLEFFWWGSVFLIAVPVMLLLLAPPRGCCPSIGIRMPAGSTYKRGPLRRRCAGTPLRAERGRRDGFEEIPAVAILFGLGVGVLFCS